MANITITVGANSITKTLSAGDVTRLINAYKVLYANKWFSGDPPAPFVPTNAQIFAEFANGVFHGVRATIVSHEKELAVQAALAGVADLVIT